MKQYDVIKFLRKQAHNVYVSGVIDVLTPDEQDFYDKLCGMYQFLTQEERYIIDYLYVQKVGNYEDCAKALKKPQICLSVIQNKERRADKTVQLNK